MKQIKTAESILRETHDNLSKPNPTDWKSFEEIMKDGTGEAMLNAMRAYAEQFIDDMAEKSRIRGNLSHKMILEYKNRLK